MDTEQTAETNIETADEVVENEVVEENAVDNEEVAENEEKFEDTKTEEVKEVKKPVQSKEQNALYAKQRRDAEVKAKIEQAETKTTIKALGGKNPFTGEKMTDKLDVEEFYTMREIQDRGGDPVAEYSKEAKAMRRKETEQVQAKQQKEEWIKTDRDEFVSKHPDVNLDEIVKDESFLAYVDGRIGEVPMTKLYSGYKALVDSFESKAKDKAVQILANKESSTGSVSKGAGGNEKYISWEKLQSMTPKEISENLTKVEASYSYYNTKK